jgi:antitoxin HicB
MVDYSYQIKIMKLSEDDGGGFIAIVPELPGCISDGESYEDALKNAKLAIEDWIETAKEIDRKIPLPKEQIK